MKKTLTCILHALGLRRRATTFCPVCAASGVVFNPLPDFYRNHAKQHGYMHFGRGEMTALETYSCAQCGATDRERLYAYWLQGEIGARRLAGPRKAIHFAPEQALFNFIRSANIFADYQTADLMMETVDHKVDLMNLPFADNSFDFFICSHVLEHVPDDLQAIRELYRITRPGGCGILMAPIIVDLPNTIEDSTVTTEADRWRLFGQFDHVRLYAHDDYILRLEECGFVVQQLDQSVFGADTFARMGLKPTSILYIVTKQ
jgi:SAM-dependent methyltransferase